MAGAIVPAMGCDFDPVSMLDFSLESSAAGTVPHGHAGRQPISHWKSSRIIQRAPCVLVLTALAAASITAARAADPPPSCGSFLSVIGRPTAQDSGCVVAQGKADIEGGVTARGFGPTTIGFKHVLGYSEHWQWTAEALATLPSGDSTFGSHGAGGALNAIAGYGDGPLGVTLEVGVTSQTEPTAAGGQRFQSFNPDLVVT